MKSAILSFAVIASLSSIAYGSGGSDIAGHPLLDARKGKQEAKASAVLPATGAVVVTGFQSLTSDGNDDFYTAKYAADGSVVWRTAKDFVGASDQGAAVVIDKWGDAIVAATIMNGGGYDVHLVRYHDTGTTTPAEVWSKTWSGAGTAADVAQGLAYDPVSDRVYLAGYTNNGTNDDYLLLAFDNNRTGDNAPLWERTYNGGYKDRAYAIAVSADGGTIAVTGESSNGADLDLATVMWQSDGTRIGIWSKAGPPSFNDRGTAVAFTATGHAVVTGHLGNGRGGDLYTAELAPASATPVWEAHHDAGFDDQSVAVGVDGAGDVYIAATIGTLPAFSKLSIMKYHNNGTAVPDIVWNTTFDGGSTNASGATGLTVDPAGGIFVAGWRDYSGIKKIMTMKLNRATGRILWNREWSGVIGNNSLPVGIGQAGPAVVTGAWTDRTQPLDGGTRAATGGSKTSLQNSGRTWATNQWAGYSLYMVSSQNKDVFRRIQGNDATTLFLATAEALPYAVVSGDLYYIYDKDDIDLLVLRQEKGTLDPPTGLATEVLSNASVRLTFEDNSETETTFVVDVKVRTAPWTANAYTITTPDQAGMNTVSYDISGLTPDTEYFFRVRAYDGSTYSDYSLEAGALTRIVNFSAPALTYVYGDPAKGDDLATDIACYSGGHVAITGTVFSDQNGIGTASKDYYTAKLSRADFSTIWKDQRDGGYDEDDEIVALAVDLNRETVVTGTSMQNVPGVGNIPSVWTLKYAPTPALDGIGEADPLWHDQLNSSGRLADQADVIAVQGVSPYAIAVAGHGHADITNINLFVRKLSATGTVLFTAERDMGGNEFPEAIAVDGSGNVIVVGRVEKTSGNDWFTAKFDGVTGTLLWSDLYGGTGDNKALSVAIDATGDIYVTGYVTDSTTGYTKMTTIKYWGNASGTADRRWIASYPTTVGTASFAARKISYDPFANEFVVAGDGYAQVTDRDLVLLRYDTAGNLLKQAELRNPGNDDTLTGLGIDPSGYVFLAADSGASPNTDVVAAIYTSGFDYVKSFLYNGTANRNDHAAAIAVNRLGEGFLAGHTTTAAGDKDFLALKVVNDLVTMPYGATATPQGDSTKVALAWSNVTTGAVPSVLRSLKDSGVWVAPPGTTGGQLNANATTFTDTGLSANTAYCWRIFATLNGVSTRHTEICATTMIPAPTIDSYANITKTSARIQWSNMAGNTGYRLERKTDTGGTWQTIANVPANTVYYDDSGLSAATTYYYRLSGQNVSGFSLPSADFMVPTMPEPVTSGWIDHYATSATTLTIRSYTSGSAATEYRFERKTGAGGTWATVATVANYPQLNDSGLSPNTTYYYRNFAIYKGIENPTPSAEITVTTWLNPATLQSATATSTTTIEASWSQVVGNSGYELSAAGCTGTVSQITANPNGYCSSYPRTTVLGTDITSGTITVPANSYRAYLVSVKAKNAGGSSVDSNRVVVYLPLAVTLTNVDIPASSQLRPTWTDTTEDNFDVQRRVPPATDWTTVATALAANTLNWTDTTVANGTEYCYRIRAYAAAGGPAETYSAESCKTAQAPPAPPALTLTTPSETTVRFDWNNTNFPAATSFDIYVRSYAYDSGALPETNGSYWSGESLATTVNCATASCTYTYTTSRGAAISAFVRMTFSGTAIDSVVASPAAGYVQTVPNAPAVSAVTATDTTVTVTYDRVNEAYSYNVYYKATTDGIWTGPVSVARNWTPTPYTITGLAPATQYQVKIESVGKTAESNSATVKNQWTLCTTPTITGITGVTTNQATVAWSSSGGATGYKLERSTDNATWTLVTNQNVLSYPDTGLAAGTTYWYRVKAVNGGGDSTPSPSVQVVLVPGTPEDPMPRQLSDSTLELRFSLVKGASAYKIYRRDGGPAAAQAYIRAAEVAYGEDYCGSAYPTISCTATKAKTAIVTDTNLQPNTVYCYALAAANGNGDSAIGQQLCGQTSAMGAPTVSVSAQTPFAAMVSWTAGSTAVPIDGHVVEAIDSDGTARTLAQVPLPAMSFTDKSGLAPGTKRTYRVRPYRRFFDDFSTGLSLTDWAPWGRHRHADGNEDFTTPPVNASDVDGTVRVSWDPSGKAELYTQVPGGITINSYNYAQIGLNRTDLFTGDFDISYDFFVDIPETIPDTMPAYNVFSRLRLYFPASAGGTKRNDTGFGYNIASSGPYIDNYTYLRGINQATGPWNLGEKQSNGIKASRRGRTVHYAHKVGTSWNPTTSHIETSTMTPDYVWITTFNNRTNTAPTVLRALIDNVEVISYGTASTPVSVTMPSFDGGQNYCP